MSTASQLAANQQNAQSSTGPQTESGKQISSQNATVTGLFAAAGNVVRPEEQEIWNQFNESFWEQLSPEGPLEASLTSEITRAAWRLRRCNLVEAGIDPALDPMESPATAALQNSIDRARTHAQRLFQRNMNELRRIQTERHFCKEYFHPSIDISDIGLASFRELLPVLDKVAPTDPVKREDAIFKILKRNVSAEQTQSESAGLPQTTPQTTPQTPRNALCPCGSGTKYKRCCGTNAPAVLGSSVSCAA